MVRDFVLRSTYEVCETVFERSFLRAKRLIARYRACNSVFTVADNRRVIQYDEILRGNAALYPRGETIARTIVISQIFPELGDHCESSFNANLNVRFLVVSAIIFFAIFPPLIRIYVCR